MIEYIFPLYI